MAPVMRLYEDSFSGGTAGSLPALARMIFVVHGAVTIDGNTLSDGEAWGGEGAASFAAGKDGATIWRFELSAAGSEAQPIKAAFRSFEKIAAALETVPRANCCCAATALRFRPAAAPSCTSTGGRASAACSTAASASTPTAARPPTVPAAPGTRPAPIRCSRRPRWTGRAASSASWCCRVRCSAKARFSSSTKRTRRSRGCSSTRFSPTSRSPRPQGRRNLKCGIVLRSSGEDQKLEGEHG